MSFPFHGTVVEAPPVHDGARSLPAGLLTPDHPGAAPSRLIASGIYRISPRYSLGQVADSHRLPDSPASRRAPGAGGAWHGSAAEARIGGGVKRTDIRESGDMDIKRNGSRPSARVSAENFTGAVRIDPLFQAPDPARATGALVTFEPGARSAWHTHPLGQTLIVTAGLGWTQCWGGPIEEIRPGDVIACPPGVKHWHGATPNTAMSHIAIQERDATGKVVEWMEKVTDEQYLAGPKRA